MRMLFYLWQSYISQNAELLYQMAFLLVHLKSFLHYFSTISPHSLEIFPSLLWYHQTHWTNHPVLFSSLTTDCIVCQYAPRPSWSESSLLSTFPVAKEFFLNFFSTGFENLRQLFQYLFTSNFWRFFIIYLHYTVSWPQAIDLDTRSTTPASQTSACIAVPSCLTDPIPVKKHHDWK